MSDRLLIALHVRVTVFPPSSIRRPQNRQQDYQFADQTPIEFPRNILVNSIVGRKVCVAERVHGKSKSHKRIQADQDPRFYGFLLPRPQSRRRLLPNERGLHRNSATLNCVPSCLCDFVVNSIPISKRARTFPARRE